MHLTSSARQSLANFPLYLKSELITSEIGLDGKMLLVWLSVMCLAQFADNALAYGLSESCVNEGSKLCAVNNFHLNGSTDLTFNSTLGQNLEIMIIKNSFVDTIPPVFGLQNKIQVFVMKKCSLREVQQKDFTEARALKTLVIQGNSIEELTEKVFYALIKLEELHLNHNLLRRLHPNSFFGLNKLKYLDLGHNKIRQIPLHLFANLFSLQYIDLQYNQIEKIDSDVFEHNSNLQTILLNNNRILVFESNSLRQLPSLHLLDVSHNPIDEMSLHSVNELRANNIGLKELHVNGSVAYLLANNNNLKRLHVLNRNLITKLELHNNIVSSISDLGCMWNLAELDLSHNPLESLDVISMTHLSNLVKLNVSATFLRNFTNSTFTLQEKLAELDLSHNHLSLDLSVFLPLKNLRVLHIDAHNLLEVDFKNLKNVLPRLEVLAIQKHAMNCSHMSSIVEHFRKIHVTVKHLMNQECKHKPADGDIKSNSSGQAEQLCGSTTTDRESCSLQKVNYHLSLAVVSLVFVIVIVLAGVFVKYPTLRKCDLPFGRIKSPRPTRLEEESNAL